MAGAQVPQGRRPGGAGAAAGGGGAKGAAEGAGEASVSAAAQAAKAWISKGFGGFSRDLGSVWPHFGRLRHPRLSRRGP